MVSDAAGRGDRAARDGGGTGNRLAAARLLGSILYGISASDPIVLVLASVVLVGTTMAACYVPARRAASVDPARTLAEQ